VLFSELEVRQCDTSVPVTKKLTNKRNRRRTLHTFKNIFDEWQNRIDESNPRGSLEILRPSDKKFSSIKCSSDAGLLDDTRETEIYLRSNIVQEDSLSVTGTFDSNESVDVVSLQQNNCESSPKFYIDSEGSKNVSPRSLHKSRSNTISNFKPNRQHLLDESSAKTIMKTIETTNLRDAHSLPNLADVGEANVLDEPVVPHRKKRGSIVTPSQLQLVRDNCYSPKSELDVRCENTFEFKRVAHAQSDDAILEQAYGDFSASEDISDCDEVDMNYFEPNNILRVSLPRRQITKQSKRSLKLHDLKRKFSFNSVDKSKEIKESFTTSLQRFKKAKNKFEKLVNKSLKKDSPTPTLIRSSQLVSSSFDRSSTIDEESQYSSWKSSKHNTAASVSSTSSSYRYPVAEATRVNYFHELKKTSRSLNFEFVNKPLSYDVNKTNSNDSSWSKDRQPDFDASDCCSVNSWGDADSDFEYYKMSPANGAAATKGSLQIPTQSNKRPARRDRGDKNKVLPPHKHKIRRRHKDNSGALVEIPSIEITFSGEFFKSYLIFLVISSFK